MDKPCVKDSHGVEELYLARLYKTTQSSSFTDSQAQSQVPIENVPTISTLRKGVLGHSTTPRDPPVMV